MAVSYFENLQNDSTIYHKTLQHTRHSTGMLCLVMWPLVVSMKPLKGGMQNSKGTKTRAVWNSTGYSSCYKGFNCQKKCLYLFTTPSLCVTVSLTILKGNIWHIYSSYAVCNSRKSTTWRGLNPSHIPATARYGVCVGIILTAPGWNLTHTHIHMCPLSFSLSLYTALKLLARKQQKQPNSTVGVQNKTNQMSVGGVREEE